MGQNSLQKGKKGKEGKMFEKVLKMEGVEELSNMASTEIRT